MAGLVWCVVVTLMLGLVVVGEGYPESALERQERLFECKVKGGACWGQIPCCGDTHCYWPDGYSIFYSGYCVDCVPRSKLCQRDEMCCGDLMCDKGYWMHYDGYCNAPKPNGGWCYRHEQCASGFCPSPRWPNSHAHCADKPPPTTPKPSSGGWFGGRRR